MKAGKLGELQINEAIWMIQNQSTMRATAKQFGRGKSTIWRDLHLVMKEDLIVREQLQQLIDNNTKERASRGGQALQRLREWKASLGW